MSGKVQPETPAVKGTLIRPHVSRAEVYQPRDLAQLQEVAGTISNSGVVPERYKGKPADIIVAGMTGAELGLGLMQSLQAIYVLRGSPGMYVEHMLALVRGSGKIDYCYTDLNRDRTVARCRLKRKDEPEQHILYYSRTQAEKAGYLKKGGAWTENEWWMLQLRATGFMLKATCSDITKGIQPLEMLREHAETHPRLVEADIMPRAIGEAAPEPEPTVIPAGDEPEHDPSVFADPAAPEGFDAPPAEEAAPPPADPAPEAPAEPKPLPPTPPEALKPRENGKAPAAPVNEDPERMLTEEESKSIFAAAKRAGGGWADIVKPILNGRGYPHTSKVPYKHLAGILAEIAEGGKDAGANG